jgi:hypothetical protein
VKVRIQLAITVAALCLAGCATSSIKQTSKSPTYQGGPVQKVAMIAVDERGLVRQGFENRFLQAFRAHGQEAVVTHDLLDLAEIKADKEGAAARLRGAGADSVFIIRLVDQTSYSRQVRATPERYASAATGFGDNYGWYDCYSVAFTDMSTVWGSTTQKIYLDTTLFDLKTGQRLWPALTLTVLKENVDRLAEADSLVGKVVSALCKDGMVRQ